MRFLLVFIVQLTVHTLNVREDTLPVWLVLHGQHITDGNQRRYVNLLFNSFECKLQVGTAIIFIKAAEVKRVRVEMMDQSAECKSIGPTAGKVIHTDTLVSSCFGSTPSEEHILDVGWVDSFCCHSFGLLKIWV